MAWPRQREHLGCELGHGLRALRHSVLRELAGEDEAHRRLDLARRERGLLVVASQLAGLARDTVEQVVDERVHHAHRLLADARLCTRKEGGTKREAKVASLC